MRNWWFFKPPSLLMIMYFFCKFFLSLTLFMTKLIVLMLYFKILQITIYFYYTPWMTILSCKSILVNSGCMFWWVIFKFKFIYFIYFFWKWAIWLAYHQKVMKFPPTLPTYTVLHDHIQSYKCIRFTLILFYIVA
jgi:hypothetical protein